MIRPQFPDPTAEETAGLELLSLARLNILMPNAPDIIAYLGEHAELASAVTEIAAELRREFTPDAVLSLELYRDPEIDDSYLTFYVRQDAYSPDLLARIDRVSEVFATQLAQASGYVLVTTDFRSIRRQSVV